MNESEKNIFYNKRGISWNRASTGKVKTLTQQFCSLRISKTLDVVLGSLSIG